MIAVIFEVEPAEGRKGEYLDIAAELRPILEGIEWFLSVERFQTLATPREVLSLSFFEDEDAIVRWRTLNAHRGAQTKGCTHDFPDNISWAKSGNWGGITAGIVRCGYSA